MKYTFEKFCLHSLQWLVGLIAVNTHYGMSHPYLRKILWYSEVGSPLEICLGFRLKCVRFALTLHGIFRFDATEPVEVSYRNLHFPTIFVFLIPCFNFLYISTLFLVFTYDFYKCCVFLVGLWGQDGGSLPSIIIMECLIVIWGESSDILG